MAYKSQDDLIKDIKDDLKTENYVALENNCKSAFKFPGLNRNQRSTLKRAFLVISRVKEEEKLYDEAIIYLEYARSLKVFDPQLFLKQLYLFEKYFDLHYENLTNYDMELISGSIDILTDQYQDLQWNYRYEKSFNFADNLQKKLHGGFFDEIYSQKSENTYRLEEIRRSLFYIKFQYLSNAERKKEICKYLSKGLLKSAKAKGLLLIKEIYK